MTEPTGSVSVFPRRRRGEDMAEVKEPVELTYELVSRFFEMKQEDAAQQLGLSLTSFKGACRRLGVVRWPYNRKYNSKQEEKELHHSSSDRSESADNDSNNRYQGDNEASYMELPRREIGDEIAQHALSDDAATGDHAKVKKKKVKRGRMRDSSAMEVDANEGNVQGKDFVDSWEESDGSQTNRASHTEVVKVEEELYMEKTIFDEVIEHVQGK
ncbi:hypothetical protein GUITHDRAFT_117246 [Guillardia theta CCMP2712]|uniref:RWP-RK domain-containing protein n=1 Tax=Guillardia theta (strain CCMP2712) TaxID=905079 RepID=L1ILB5_GUITC|nr:hypothetical protein GUITHDRAFT_117246 [Guillardia theta CCMP2712]EKX36590.1 hypothetical protein GUITHDRAFT_117246 [Guillardia theta CCMP2712]|eukprot:XP_005823570.1 hypothetical protein GUITHDRAFT_117246 [Guillardia theta CCMP2712]